MPSTTETSSPSEHAEDTERDLPDGKKRSVVEKVLDELSDAPLLNVGKDGSMFESRSNRGHFYVPLQNGQAQWCPCFTLQNG